MFLSIVFFMDMLSTILENLTSLMDTFDFNLSIYQTSLNSLYQFTNDNVESININRSISSDTLSNMRVIPSLDSDNPDSVIRFYKREWKNAIELRVKLESDLEEIINIRDTLPSNIDNNQTYNQTYTQIKTNSIGLGDKLNQILPYHKQVI